MTRIEKAIKAEKENILKRYCPSDYGLDEYRECAFKRDNGCVDEEECFECWNEEIEEEDKRMKMIVDYIPAAECKAGTYTCLKCEKCGRKFENGFLVDDGGTHVEDEYEEYEVE